MMNNQYGNYVVQNILSISEFSQRSECLRLISPHIGKLRGSKYGQRVAVLCEKLSRQSSINNCVYGKHQLSSMNNVGMYKY